MTTQTIPDRIVLRRNHKSVRVLDGTTVRRVSASDLHASRALAWCAARRQENLRLWMRRAQREAA